MMKRIKQIFWLWQQCFRSMTKIKTFIPFAFYATLQLVILISLVNFINPPFVMFYIPLIRQLFGEGALHYPTFFYILPPLFNQLNFVLSGLVGIILIGVATHVFAYNFMRDKISIRIAIRRTFSKYPSLLLIWIAESVISMTIILGLPFVLTEFLAPDYMVTRIFAYTTAYIVLSYQSFGRSIAQTFVTFKKNIMITFALVAIPTFLYMPISYLTGKTNVIISKFSPEMVATILGLGIIISFLTNYFQINTITRFYIHLNDKK